MLDLTTEEVKMLLNATQSLVYNVQRLPLAPDLIDAYLKLQQKLAAETQNGAVEVLHASADAD